jgi:hypothetical protein
MAETGVQSRPHLNDNRQRFVDAIERLRVTSGRSQPGLGLESRKD